MTIIGLIAPATIAKARDVYKQWKAQREFDALIDLITKTVKPTAWDDVGGPGSISEEDRIVCELTVQDQQPRTGK